MTSPLNGVEVEVPIKQGAIIKENDIVLIIESMKMKTNILSPFSGQIKSMEVNIGDKVKAN